MEINRIKFKKIYIFIIIHNMFKNVSLYYKLINEKVYIFSSLYIFFQLKKSIKKNLIFKNS